jgi:uncharacterized Zn finger protein (UPF0148 family)
MIHQYYGIPKDASWKGFMERFPILFQNKDKSMRETCMCWGIDCPIGWYHILEQLCTILEFYNMEFTKNYGIAIVADQVKEKFGTLRFYYTPREVNKDGVVTDLMDGEERVADEEKKHRIAVEYLELLADQIIAEADQMTENTCARCGIPLDKNNKVETKGWISYICSECDGKPYEEEDEQEEETESKESEKTDEKAEEVK